MSPAIDHNSATPALDDQEIALNFARMRGQEREQAFTTLFARHRRRVYQLAHQLTGNSSLAEDTLQETFLQVYRDLPAFRGEAQLSTWIYRIAMRTAIRVRARQAAHRSSVQSEAFEESHLSEDVNPEQMLAARERVRRVRAAMDKLPIEQRAVLALFAVEGLGHAMIAEILGIPEGTVWSRLHQARKVLTSIDAR
jgi:RNA polymerase sigma-70 factor (ECF subfamily)